jgi:hypothetical protein
MGAESVTLESLGTRRTRMKYRVAKIKKHFRDNKGTYIGVGAGIVVGAAAATVLILKQLEGNTAIVDSYNLIKYKSPHTSQLIQVLIPPRGNAGNAIQCNETGTIYPSQNLAAQELGLSAGNLTAHLKGDIPKIKGLSFTKLTENGVPVEVA